MHKRNWLLFAGLTLMFAATARANTTTPLAQCGSVGSAGNGNVAFTSIASGIAGTASVSGGVGIITCTGFTVPTGDTLLGITFEVTDDANQSTGTNSQVTWTWTYSGEALTPVPSATNSESGNATFGFNTCTGTGTLVCNTFENFSTLTLHTSGQTTGSFTFDVTPSATGVGGAGLGPTGSDSARVFVEFTYSTPATATPEPTSLSLAASGLIGLAFSACRRRKTVK